MALGQNTIIETIIGRYKDEASKQITKSFKDLAKITLGPFLAIRTIENSFRAIADYAREHYTTSRDIVLELDKSSDRTLAIVSNSEAFKAAMGGAVVVLEQINELLGDITDKTIKEAEMRLDISETAAKFATEQVDVTKLTGEQREDFFHMQRFYSDLVVKAKEEVKVLKEKKKILDESMIKVKPKKLDDALKASKIGPAAAQADALIMEDFRVAQNETELREKQWKEYRDDLNRRSEAAKFWNDQRLRELEIQGDEEESLAQDRIDNENRIKEAREANLIATQNFLGQVAGLIQANTKKNFIAYKIAAIAEATIATYLAATKALPNFALAGLVIAAGLANVLRIASTNMGSGGSKGSSATSGNDSGRRDSGSTGGAQTNTGPQVNLQLRFDRVYGRVDEDFARGVTESVKDILINDKRLDRFTL